jgi:hypothetical protein
MSKYFCIVFRYRKIIHPDVKMRQVWRPDVSVIPLSLRQKLPQHNIHTGDCLPRRNKNSIIPQSVAVVIIESPAIAGIALIPQAAVVDIILRLDRDLKSRSKILDYHRVGAIGLIYMSLAYQEWRIIYNSICENVSIVR